MSATVTVKYLLKDKSDTETMDIKLVKEKRRTNGFYLIIGKLTINLHL